MSLFIRKPLSQLLSEAEGKGSGALRRVLGPFGLIAFGVGIIVGAGLFSITGLVASHYPSSSQPSAADSQDYAMLSSRR